MLLHMFQQDMVGGDAGAYQMLRRAPATLRPAGVCRPCSRTRQSMLAGGPGEARPHRVGRGWPARVGVPASAPSRYRRARTGWARPWSSGSAGASALYLRIRLSKLTAPPLSTCVSRYWHSNDISAVPVSLRSRTGRSRPRRPSGNCSKIARRGDRWIERADWRAQVKEANPGPDEL